MSTVATNTSLVHRADNGDTQMIHTASNGDKIALLRTGDLTGAYVVSSDGGQTWGSPVAVPVGVNIPGAFNLTLLGDVLYVWEVHVAGTVNIRCTKLPYSLSGKTLGTATAYDYHSVQSLVVIEGGAAWYDGTRWHVAFMALDGGFGYLYVFATTVTGDSPVMQRGLVPFSAVTGQDLVQQSGVLYTVMTDSTAKKVKLVGYAWTGTAYTLPNAPTVETAYSAIDTDLQAVAIVDQTNTFFLVVRDGTALKSITRTGAMAYGSAIPLSSSVSGAFTYVLDGVVGTLTVVFPTTINQPNGELYSIRRSTGSWGAAAVLVSGAGGAAVPSLNEGAVGGLGDLVYATTAATSGATVTYLGIPTSLAPRPPVITAPVGDVDATVPVVAHWNYVASAPSDPQSAVQLLYAWSGGSYDTGKVSTAASNLAYAGPTLPHDVPISVKAQVWDTTANSGLGAASGYGPSATFALRNVPAVTIISVSSDGSTVTSGGTMGGPDVTIDVSMTQADGHAASAWQIVAYSGADHVTLVDASPITTLSLASGGSATIGPWLSTRITNGMAVELAVRLTDATSGVVGESARFPVTAVWTPPASPTGLTATVLADQARIRLAWTNPSGTVRNRIYSQQPSRAEQLEWEGPVTTTKDLVTVPAGIAMSFRVTAIAANGLESL